MTHPGSLHVNYASTLVFVVGASSRVIGDTQACL